MRFLEVGCSKVGYSEVDYSEVGCSEAGYLAMDHSEVGYPEVDYFVVKYLDLVAQELFVVQIDHSAVENPTTLVVVDQTLPAVAVVQID